MARTKGASGKKTRMALHAAQTGDFTQVLAGSSPVDYLLKVMRDPDKPDQLRLEAAKAAAPYIQPRLTTIDQTIRGGASYSDDLKAIALLETAVPAAEQKH
jgi:hypothetical protein